MNNFTRSLLLLVPILLIMVITTVIIVSGYQNLNPSPLFTSRVVPSSLPVTTNSSELEIQGWIYPGEETCTVANELRSGLDVDTLKIEFFTISEAGDIVLLTEEELGCNAYSPESVSMIKKYSTSQFITISGRHENMVRFLASDEKINKAVKDLTSFVNQNALTGIEIDFEDFSSWTGTEYQAYLSFISLLGDSLITSDKQLLVAGPPIANKIDQSLYQWKYSDFNELPVDQIVVMAYDYQADHGNGRAVAPLDWVAEVIAFTKAEIVDYSKLVIGVPAYGYTGKKNQYTATLLTKAQATERLNDFSQAKRDPHSFELIAQNADEYLVYQDQQAIQQKVEFILSQGISKISIWHLGNNEWYKKSSL